MKRWIRGQIYELSNNDELNGPNSFMMSTVEAPWH